jgi:hypothetical protein
MDLIDQPLGRDCRIITLVSRDDLIGLYDEGKHFLIGHAFAKASAVGVDVFWVNGGNGLDQSNVVQELGLSPEFPSIV